jgi:hypothetical protein
VSAAVQMTAEEMSNSLTGFDEIAIEKHMEMDIYMDAETKPVKALRSLVFIAKTREGLTAPDARQAALEMSMSQVNDFFAEDDEPNPDEPVTEAGKDDEPSD